MSFSMSHSMSSARIANKTFVKRATIRKPNNTLRRAVVHTPRIKHVTKKIDKKVLGTGTSTLARKSTLGANKLNFAKLPLHKAAAGNTHLVGRLSVPKNFKPKLALAHAPNAALKLRLSPFVQRHWKKAFFWVAVAGFGYLTIPEIYYDRFLGYVSVDDPDYEGCIHLLSLAAVEEEEEIVRVRRPMPANAVYRYSATVAPEPVSSGPSCTFEPFIERNWSRPYVWVQIPKVGNVTVPEEFYDRFYGFVVAAPPNYSAACAVLVEAAAADTVATTSFDFGRPEFR